MRNINGRLNNVSELFKKADEIKFSPIIVSRQVKISQHNNDLMNVSQRLRIRNRRQKEMNKTHHPWGSSFLLVFVFLERFQKVNLLLAT